MNDRNEPKKPEKTPLTVNDIKVMVEYLNAKHNPSKCKERYRWVEIDSYFYYVRTFYDMRAPNSKMQYFSVEEEEENIAFIQSYFNNIFRDKYHVMSGSYQRVITNYELLQQLKNKAYEYKEIKQAYIIGAMIGMFSAKKPTIPFKPVSIVGSFVKDKKDGKALAETCKQANHDAHKNINRKA